MKNIIKTKFYPSLEIDNDEIFRYAGCKNPSQDVICLLNQTLCEIKDKFAYKVCFSHLPIKIDEDVCDFFFFSVKSKDLANNLKGCKMALVFAATLGTEIDRQISKYSRISPSKALMLDAIGSAQIEKLCDVFLEEMKHELGGKFTPRFSSGYGDLPLESQNEIFAALNPFKNIGLSITDSFIMTPSKSVTAFVGLKK